MYVVLFMFIISLSGIVALFALKVYESTHALVIAADWRARADDQARQLKERLMRVHDSLDHVGPLLVLITRYAIHRCALATARGAHMVERGARILADRVSMKYTYIPRATTSEFLKKVAQRD